MASSPSTSITIASALGKLHAVLQPAAELATDDDEGWAVISRPLIVLLHGEGRSASWKAWESALEPLGMLGYTCAALDMPGYGDSEGNREEGKARIDEVIQAVCKGTGSDTCVVVGRAEGGRGALNAAAQAKRNGIAAIIVCHPVAPAEATLKSVVTQKCPTLVTWARDEKSGQLFTAPHGAAYFVRHLGCDLVPWDCAGEYGGDQTLFYKRDFCDYVHRFLLSRLARRQRRRRTCARGARTVDARAIPAALCTSASTAADVTTAVPITSPVSRSVSARLFGMKAAAECDDAVVLAESDDEIAIPAESEAVIGCEAAITAPTSATTATVADVLPYAADEADGAADACSAALKVLPSPEAAVAAPEAFVSTEAEVVPTSLSAMKEADVAGDTLVEEEDGGECASELRIAASEADDWRYELQECWVDCGGHRLHLLTQGPPEGPVVALLLHGDGPRSSNEHWRPALGPLSEREVYAIAVSLPGYGLSPGSRSVFRSATDAVNLILALSRELKLQGRLVIGGRSVGGKVALQVAAHDPKAVRGLLLTHPVSPGPGTLAQVRAPCLLTWAKDDAGGPGHPGNHPYFGPNGAAFMVQKVHCELYSWEERAILRQAGLDVKRDFANRTDAHFAAEALFYSENYPVRVVSWLHARGILRR